MNTVILIIFVLAGMISILGDQPIGNGIALNVLNISNTNNMNVNGADGNATIPDTQTGSGSEDNETGNIVSLPGKCLGSALCPD